MGVDQTLLFQLSVHGRSKSLSFASSHTRQSGKGWRRRPPFAIGALPIKHGQISALPLMLITVTTRKHGWKWRIFCFAGFQTFASISMIAETAAAKSLPEKFEELAGKVKGAIAILTPDDFAAVARDGSTHLTGPTECRHRSRLVLGTVRA